MYQVKSGLYVPGSPECPTEPPLGMPLQGPRVRYDLVTKCIKSSLGCTFQGPRSALQSHLWERHYRDQESGTGCQPIPIFLLNSYILGPNPIFLSTGLLYSYNISSAKTQSGWTFGFHFCQKMNFQWGIFRWHFCFQRHLVGAKMQKFSFCFQAF